MKPYYDFILFSCFIGQTSETFRPFFISAQSLVDVRVAGELQKGKTIGDDRWLLTVDEFLGDAK